MQLPSILRPLLQVSLPLQPEPDVSAGGRDVSTMQPAGVLVLFFPGRQGASFFLTERPGDLSRHPGQISLPGGRREVEDGSLWQTALRETREELGIRTGRLLPLGRLPPVPVRVSRYLIHPFLAWSPVRPRLAPDPREVAGVLEVPASVLLDPAAIAEERWHFRGSYWDVTFYRFEERSIWGATARILSEVARLLQETPVWATYAPGTVRAAAPRD